MYIRIYVLSDCKLCSFLFVLFVSSCCSWFLDPVFIFLEGIVVRCPIIYPEKTLLGTEKKKKNESEKTLFTAPFRAEFNLP